MHHGTAARLQAAHCAVSHVLHSASSRCITAGHMPLGGAAAATCQVSKSSSVPGEHTSPLRVANSGHTVRLLAVDQTGYCSIHKHQK
jgi:5-enolpyruvylshikimate-3-phosphate synthase